MCARSRKRLSFGLWREPGVTHRRLSLACKLTLAGLDRPPGRDDAHGLFTTLGDRLRGFDLRLCSGWGQGVSFRLRVDDRIEGFVRLMDSSDAGRAGRSGEPG